ncbi:MAG: RHS repeat protein [Opitutales bacterium]|nr:RHS repeat protein [Opitutales bacterium]
MNYDYDGNGNLEVITDGNGNKTKYVYDAMNRRTSAIYGYESETTRSDTWVYDALNMTNRKGVAITYDARNRILTENSRTYAYDPAGRILSVSGYPNANVSYAYDALGRILSETNGGRTHNYAYDLSSRRVKSDYGLSPTQLTPTHSLSYKYDTNGRLVSITDQQNRTTSYSYDLNGNVLKKIHANGYELIYTYDALNRLKSQIGTLLDNRYYYDLGGNITYFFNSQNSGSAVNRWEGSLSYDAFDRLVSEMLYDGVTVKTTNYTYDKNSNRTSRTLVCDGSGNPNWYTETTTYEINSLNQVVSATKTHQDLEPFINTPIGVNTTTTSQISYNERGNLASLYDGEYTTTFLYDAYDMLVDTFKGKGEGANYEQIRTQSTYDYRGRRIKREVSSIGLTSKTKTKEYSYADGVSVLETSTSGMTLTYRGSDQGGGVGGVNYTEYSNGNELNYKIYNLRGDVIKTVGANKNTKSFSHYYAFF